VKGGGKGPNLNSAGGRNGLAKDGGRTFSISAISQKVRSYKAKLRSGEKEGYKESSVQKRRRAPAQPEGEPHFRVGNEKGRNAELGDLRRKGCQWSQKTAPQPPHSEKTKGEDGD